MDGVNKVKQFLQNILFNFFILTLYLRAIFLANCTYLFDRSGCFLNSFLAKPKSISILSPAIFCCHSGFFDTCLINLFWFFEKKRKMGKPRFELGSPTPKAGMLDQAIPLPHIRKISFASYLKKWEGRDLNPGCYQFVYNPKVDA